VPFEIGKRKSLGREGGFPTKTVGLEKLFRNGYVAFAYTMSKCVGANATSYLRSLLEGVFPHWSLMLGPATRGNCTLGKTFLYPRLDNPSVNLSTNPGRVLRVDWSCRTFVILITRDKDAGVIPQFLSSEVYHPSVSRFSSPTIFGTAGGRGELQANIQLNPYFICSLNRSRFRQHLFISGAFVHFFHRNAHTILVFSNSKRAMPSTVWP
jgi:hypothetical protein